MIKLEKLNDPDIRKLLYGEFLKKDEFITDPTTVVVNELDVSFGAARIDVAVVNGKLHGFEIKSERDNLDRLPSQVELYSKTFDTLTLVISEVHLAKARKIIPKWWGIYCVKRGKFAPRIKIIRNSKKNNAVDPLNLTHFLWKSELLELLEANCINKGVKSKTRYELGKIAVDKIGSEVISHFVRNKLKNREVWRALPLQQLCGDLKQ
jgi:hypothetical protein